MPQHAYLAHGTTRPLLQVLFFLHINFYIHNCPASSQIYHDYIYFLCFKYHVTVYIFILLFIDIYSSSHFITYLSGHLMPYQYCY